MEKTYYENFYKPFSSYDGSMMHINHALESVILEYTEFVLEEHYITESTNTNLWTKVKQFFTKLIHSDSDKNKRKRIKKYVIIFKR